MNITTYFFCDCGYEKALNEGEDYSVIQCNGCLNLASIEKSISYYISCSACEFEKKIQGEITFNQEETCENCKLKGKVGLKDIHPDALFLVESKVEYDGKCERCRKTEWTDPEESEYKCPSCYRKLKQKMSSAWE